MRIRINGSLFEAPVYSKGSVSEPLSIKKLPCVLQPLQHLKPHGKALLALGYESDVVLAQEAHGAALLAYTLSRKLREDYTPPVMSRS